MSHSLAHPAAAPPPAVGREVAARRPVAPRPTASGEAHAARDWRKFCNLAAQLTLLLAVFWGYQLEDSGFLLLGGCCLAGFVVHYLLPFRWKKHGFVALSLLGGLVILGHAEYWNIPWHYAYIVSAFLLAVAVALGLAFYFCLRLPLPFHVRLAAVLAIVAVVAWARVTGGVLLEAHWSVLAGLFMFRMFLYVYEVRVGRAPERLSDFLTYFFCLPNFYYSVFPVIDYDTFKKSFYSDDIHATAQRGISWMARGALHLCLYRLINHNWVIGAEQVQSPWTLAQYVFPTYLLYLQVSGRFHLIVGMLHLFGYKLPETNRNWLLADSFTDFWRRINIYWKDFMVRTVYYPVFFRFRKKNEVLALSLATACVFVVTWALHGYQFFWLKGRWFLHPQDILFWTILGGLVLATLLWERREGRAKPRSRLAGAAVRAAKILFVYVTVSVLWSMWSNTSLAEWWDTMTYWRTKG